jgi:hypothetical protein
MKLSLLNILLAGIGNLDLDIKPEVEPARSPSVGIMYVESTLCV